MWHNDRKEMMNFKRGECVRRARDVLFWLSIESQIKKKVQNREVCNYVLARQQNEPLMTHKIPDTPWSKVCQNLFTYGITTVITVITLNYI